MADLREELKRLEMEAASIAADLGAIAEDAERAIAAQPAPMSRNDAFNLADTVAEHYACGRPEEARQAIMALVVQPAAVPEARAQRSLSTSWGGEVAYDKGWNDCRAAMLAAAPSPDHSPGAGKMVTKAKADAELHPIYVEAMGINLREAQAGADDWRHIANEWADVATNGPTILRNVRDGLLSVDDAIAGMETDFRRVRAAQAKPAEGGAVNWRYAVVSAREYIAAGDIKQADAMLQSALSAATAGSGEAVGEVYALPTGERRVQLAKHARELPIGMKLYAGAPAADAEALARKMFVEGAKWWEFKKTGATMWPSDQGEAWDASEAKLRRLSGGKGS